MSNGSIPVEFQNVYFKIEQYCASQEHCSFDVKRKLAQQSVPSEIIDQIIEKLIEKNFINYNRYCEAFTNDHIKLKKWGRIKIKAALKAKSLPDASINNAIEKIDTELYLRNLMHLYSRKKNELTNENNLEKRKAKLIRYLASNGYELEIIFNLFD